MPPKKFEGFRHRFLGVGGAYLPACLPEFAPRRFRRSPLPISDKRNWGTWARDVVQGNTSLSSRKADYSTVAFAVVWPPHFRPGYQLINAKALRATRHTTASSRGRGIAVSIQTSRPRG
jgi:hypothetical protein